MSEQWHDDHKKAIAQKWTQCPPVTVKVKELISGQVCMGTYGLVELEVMQLERELIASKADRVAISQKLSDALDALFASNKQLAEALAETESKNKLIEQMREALQRTMILLDAVPSYAQDYAKDEKLKQIGKMVNTDGLYALVRDALAAERGE